MSGILLHAEQSIGKQMFLFKYDYTKSSCNSLCLPSISNVLDILAPYCCKAERNNRLCMELHVQLDKTSIDSSDLFKILQETKTTCIKNDEKIPRYSVVNMSAF